METFKQIAALLCMASLFSIFALILWLVLMGSVSIWFGIFKLLGIIEAGIQKRKGFKHWDDLDGLERRIAHAHEGDRSFVPYSSGPARGFWWFIKNGMVLKKAIRFYNKRQIGE